MSTAIPKKFYRNVVRGVSYYNQEENRPCNLDELVAYVYLKNSRALPVQRVEPIVQKALADLCGTGLIQKVRNNYRLNENLVDQLGPEDTQEDRAGPSGVGRTTKRKVASRRKQRGAVKPRKRSRSGMRPAVDAIDGVPEPAAGDSQEEDESEMEEEFDSEDEATEVLPHRPLKLEKEDSEDQQVPVVVSTVASALTSEPKANLNEHENAAENSAEQGSSSTESSSAWSWFKFW